MSKAESLKQIDIERLISEIRDEVASKRAEGAYPPGLEQELEAEFRLILSHSKRGLVDRSREVNRLFEELQKDLSHLSGLTPANSRIPGLSIVHRIIRRLVSRQTMGLAGQIRTVEQRNQEIMRILAEQGKLLEDADVSLAAGLTKHVLDRVAVVDHLAYLVTELEARVRKLEAP